MKESIESKKSTLSLNVSTPRNSIKTHKLILTPQPSKPINGIDSDITPFDGLGGGSGKQFSKFMGSKTDQSLMDKMPNFCKEYSFLVDIIGTKDGRLSTTTDTSSFSQKSTGDFSSIIGFEGKSKSSIYTAPDSK
jgi:hypothetical protein